MCSFVQSTVLPNVLSLAILLFTPAKVQWWVAIASGCGVGEGSGKHWGWDTTARSIKSLGHKIFGMIKLFRW